VAGCVVRRSEIMLDGPCQLREDGSAALERLDDCLLVAVSAVSREGLTWKPFGGVATPSPTKAS